jgi:hypothetical protein
MPDQSPLRPEDEERIRRMVEKFERSLRKNWKPDPQSYDEIEEEAQQIGEDVKRIIEDEGTKTLGSGFVGSRLRCRCGGRAKYKGLYVRSIISRSGVHRIQRAYYYCASCRSGRCPLDDRLGLGSEECTPRVRGLVARFCSYLPFQLAAGELEIICGIKLAASTLEEYAYSVGRRLQEHWALLEKQLLSGRISECGHRPTNLHIAMDGVFVFVDGDWREVKLGCAYEKSRDGGVDRSTYYATLARSLDFGRRMRVVGHQSGLENCRNIAVLGDGIPWIWNEAAKHFPRFPQILDFYHVTQHLWLVANARFGPSTEAASVWMADKKNLLLNNKAGEVIEDVVAWHPSGLERCELKRKTIDYLKEHLHRMKYESFDKQGFHIGSGVIESGCKTVVQARMKGAGMRWSTPGAEAMLHLCANWRSNPRQGFDRLLN